MSEFTDELKRLDLAINLPSKTYFAIEEKFKDWQPPKPQQALPVVPEDVDKAIKYLENNPNSTFSDLCDILTNKGLNWLNDFQIKDRRFGFGGLNNKLFILSHLAITGYTVEKEKLYKVVFLKTSDDEILLLKSDTFFIDWNSIYNDLKYQFTEAEIKEIDKRYWAFAVPVKEVEP